MFQFTFFWHHLVGFTAGFVLDLIIGDPYWLPHPVRAIGKTILFYEKKLIGTKEKPAPLTRVQKRRRGKLMVFLVIFTVELAVVPVLLLGWFVSQKMHFCADIFIEAIITFQLLATKSLKTESLKVYFELKNGNLAGARKAVSMIVGRDTDKLTEKEVAKAAVETVAENTSDGVIAPMLFLALGGPVLGFLYKCVNTMDSMIGYTSERYVDFGRCAAKTDDLLNFIPARLTACFMLAVSFLYGKKFNGRNALKVYRRDRHKHASPNAGHPESVCAGALEVQLAGPAFYGGELEEKEYLGDALREIENEDIKKSHFLLYNTAFLCMFFCVLFIASVLFVFSACI